MGEPIADVGGFGATRRKQRSRHCDDFHERHTLKRGGHEGRLTEHGRQGGLVFAGVGLEKGRKHPPRLLAIGQGLEVVGIRLARGR